MPGSIFDFMTPSFTNESNAVPEGQFEHTDVDMDAIKAPLSDELLSRLKGTLNRDKKAHDIYYGLIEKPSRSEYDFTLTQRLRWDGYSLQDVAHILWHYSHGKGSDLTKREIIRNYNRVGAGPFPPLDPIYIAEIEKQVNPILSAQEKGKPLAEDLQGVTVFSYKMAKDAMKNWRHSGNPIYKNLLYESAITVVYGESNVGKSFVVADIAGHVSLGRNWGNFKYKPKKADKSVRPIGVVYIAAEAGKGFRKRLKALAKRLGLEDLPLAVIDEAPKFVKSMDDARKIAETIKQIEKDQGFKIGLVVVDTLATTFEGGNENSSEDMGMYISNMKWIQRYADTGVLIVHHSGKNQAAGARGHSSLRAATDTEIEVLSEKKGERYHRTIKVRKQREGESDLTIKFGLMVLELGKDEDGDIIDTCHVVLENDTEFEAVDISPEDEIKAKGQKAAFLTAQKFQEAEFLNKCSQIDSTEIGNLMVAYWFFKKSNMEKSLSFEELLKRKLPPKFKSKKAQFQKCFNKIRHLFDKTEITLDQWIREYIVKPSQGLSCSK